jgi:hypothetical protein
MKYVFSKCFICVHIIVLENAKFLIFFLIKKEGEIINQLLNSLIYCLKQCFKIIN